MLIIFDCDGVLVDSEPLAARVFAQHLAAFGVALSPADCEEKFRGHTLDRCFQMLHREYPGALPPDFLDGLASLTQEVFGRELLPVAGVASALQWIQAEGLSFCVASNGALAKVRHSLEVTGLADVFGDRCFSAEQVANGKPAPDLFLLAAKVMNVEPDQALVIEDSAAGVTAALAAKMRVLRYGPPFELDGRAVASFTDMHHLPNLIKAQLRLA